MTIYSKNQRRIVLPVPQLIRRMDKLQVDLFKPKWIVKDHLAKLKTIGNINPSSSNLHLHKVLPILQKEDLTEIHQLQDIQVSNLCQGHLEGDVGKPVSFKEHTTHTALLIISKQEAHMPWKQLTSHIVSTVLNLSPLLFQRGRVILACRNLMGDLVNFL